ncbi:DNA-binding response regulator [Pseudomonas fluorescens]|uniref:DNA-binding response regulator n=1 Tax=Pseudomonas fluorescens TaxID=294 RepID=A0A327MUU6_PSEFL|nr:response regulator [Pseudomonas fluorescens]RAI66541.1 DNA-binding response regulator [Pseudomonas fluorescens]
MIIVCIVDDDASVRKSLANLLRSAGYRSRVFTSGEEFLALENFDDIACLLLDLKMNGLSGIEVMHALTLKDGKFPVICMSAHWDEATLAETSRYEPIECLRKPFSGEALLSAVEFALQCER